MIQNQNNLIQNEEDLVNKDKKKKVVDKVVSQPQKTLYIRSKKTEKTGKIKLQLLPNPTAKNRTCLKIDEKYFIQTFKRKKTLEITYHMTKKFLQVGSLGFPVGLDNLFSCDILVGISR